MRQKLLFIALLLSFTLGGAYAGTITPATTNQPKYVISNPEASINGHTQVLHDFYLFKDSDCRELIGVIKAGTAIEVLHSEFRYYRTAKGRISRVLHDYDRLGLKVGDVFDILFWCEDDTWLVGYKGKLTYLPFRPDFETNRISAGVYDYSDQFEGYIIDNQEDKTILLLVRLNDNRLGWIKIDNRGFYEGIYRHIQY